MDSSKQTPALRAVPNKVTDIEYQATSLDIWENKYCLKTKQGEMVDADMDATFQRVAKALAEVESEEIREH